MSKDTKVATIQKTFAQWDNLPHFKVTFDPGPNATISGSNVVDRYQGQLMQQLDVPTIKAKDHYVFKGWSPEFKEHNITQNETYTAICEYIAANVHFEVNGGDPISDIVCDQGSKVEVLDPRHRTGIFVGWYSDSGLQTPVDLNTWKMPTPAVETTFYAKWDMNAAKRVVSYVVNGGTATFTSVVKVLVDSEGWASTSGSYTLVEADIPTVTADATHEGTPTWIPKNPLGSALNTDATFTATFAEKRVRVQVVGNDHVDIENGDQTVVIGSTITPIVIRPKSGWGYGYSNDNLTALSGNGLTAIYSGYDNSITISGSLSTDTTLTAPTCSASGDFIFIFCDSTSCAEISGMVYNLSEDNKITWLTVNGTTDINSLTKIYGLTAGTNIVLSVKEVPAGFNMPGSDISYGVKGRTDEVCILYGSVGSVLPGTDPTIVEIHQNVVGSESNKLDIFRYDVNINNSTTRLYIQGTKDAKLTGTMGTHTYSIVQLDENKYGYITSIISGSLSGSVNTNSGVPAILTTKYLKGEDNNGELEITFVKNGAYVEQSIGDKPAPLTEDISIKCGISLFGADVNGLHGNVNFTNGFGEKIIKLHGGNGTNSSKLLISSLPTCTYGISTEVVYPNYWPDWAKDHVILNTTNANGQIMNTTKTTANFTMDYKTSGTWQIQMVNEVISPFAVISLHNKNDDNVNMDINAVFGDVKFVNGSAEVNGVDGETLSLIDLPAESKRLKIQTYMGASENVTKKVTWYQSSNNLEPYPNDANGMIIDIGAGSTDKFLLEWLNNYGIVDPDPNCNVADVLVDNISAVYKKTTFNWNQTLKVVYKNSISTGGVNAMWVVFGETYYTEFVTNSNVGNINVGNDYIELVWQGLPQDQYDLVNVLKDDCPLMQIHDENGLPSKFVIVNAGCTHKKTLHPELILNIDVSEVGGEGVSQNIYGVVKETPSSTPVNVIIYSQGGIGNPAYITKNLKPFESVTELSKFTVVNEVCLHTDTITAPQYGKYESDYLTGWTRFSDGETVKYIPNYLDPITAQYKSVCYRIFGIESGAKTIDVKGQRLLSGDYADPADYQADSPINRPWPDIQNSESCCMIHGDTMNFLVSSITPITYMVNSLESTLEFEIVADINNYEMYNPTRYDLERIINDRVLKDSIKLSSDKVTIKGIRVRSFTSPTLPVGNELSTKPYTIKCSIDMISNASSGTKVDLAAKNMTVFNDASRDVDSGKFMTISIIFITPPHGKY